MGTSTSNERVVELTSSESDATVMFTSPSAAGGNGGQSRDEAITEHDVMLTTSATNRQTDKSVAESPLQVTGDRPTITDDAVGGGLASQRDSSSWPRRVTLSRVNDVSSVTPRLTNISLAESSTSSSSSSSNASRHHRHSRLLQPLALRSAADNASVSAAVGSDVADRRAGSGLLREEVATVGAAVAGVLVFWSLLAFAMCAVVRLRKRQQRRQLSGRSRDVDAQTAMMEAMVRAELARGRSRVSDSRLPPTYVNVS